MPDLNVLMPREKTGPGDMLIRYHAPYLTKGEIGMDPIGGFISTASKSPFVHGGLAIGGNEVVEVNGGLNPDSSGNSRILANIYKTNLTTDLKDNDYVVYRCRDTTLAKQVAIEATVFVKAGTEESWGYNLIDALKSLGSPSPDTGQFLFVDENESVLSVAMRRKQASSAPNGWFICT